MISLVFVTVQVRGSVPPPPPQQQQQQQTSKQTNKHTNTQTHKHTHTHTHTHYTHYTHYTLQVIVGCFGWLADLVTEWKGQSNQPLPFANPDAPQWSASNASYSDVRDMVSAIKIAGARAGLPRLKVASLHVGWASLYDIPEGPLKQRHPELYMGNGFNHAACHNGSMTADAYPYASQPSGARAGQDFFALWGSQWASFSTFAGLGAVVIRDGFSTHANYRRTGP
jgi:hypothetical protein